MSHEQSNFPLSIWDGLSKNEQRQTRHDQIEPNPEDYNKISSELIETQEYTTFVTTEGRVGVKFLPGSDLQTLQDHINATSSAGRIAGGSVTDAGGGKVDVAKGRGLIRDMASETADLFHFCWSDIFGITIPTNTTAWVVVKFNSGSPLITLNADHESITHTDEFSLAVVVNVDGVLHINQLYDNVLDTAGRVVARFYETLPMARDDRLGGIILTNIGTRNLALSPGAIWEKLNRYVITAQDTTGSDTFETFYRDGSGGFTRTTDVTQWPNTQYDDGSGTLATLVTNKYTNLFFYVEVDNHFVMLYGQEQHNTLASALNEAPPTSLPERLKEGGRIIARLVFQKDSDIPDSIVSAFAQV